MKSIHLTAALALLGSCGGSFEQSSPSQTSQLTSPATSSPSKLTYPETRREDVVDTYHGTDVADPYRWLEDPDTADSRAWIEAQNEVTFSYLDTIPQRERIRERLTKLWDYEKYGVPHKEGGRYFFSKNDGLQNQSVLYWAESLDSEPKVLLDPNVMSEDGTVALAGYSISENGKHMAYGLQKAGSDWAEWHVRAIDSGKDLDETLEWIKFSGATWDKDSTGFYYGRYPQPSEGQSLTDANFNQKLYFHKVGTPQSQDQLVFEQPENPKYSSSAEVSEDGRYLVISVGKGTGPMNLVYYKDLKAKGKGAIKPLIDTWEANYSFLGNQGQVLWFSTDLEAPRGRVISIDLRNPKKSSWKQVVAQNDATLRGASLVGGKLFTTYLRDAYSEIVVRDLKGAELSKVELPGIGSASGFGGKMKDTETFYSFTNFTIPSSIYRYDIASGQSTIYKQPTVDTDPSAYEIKQVFYTSKDGTKVPMFITHKKGMQLDGHNPTLLYGYGGFSIPLTPYFSVSYTVWLEMGGVLAIPNLRGGGEYGEEWHLAGTKLNKQNVFDDFIAAAEWLIANKYTSTPKLAISGRSNGGLLVGAAMTQRPDLFGAALPGVGVMDMLRFHTWTIGWAWVDDYGSSEDPEEFKALHAYSPYHNLRPAQYPATMVITADHDDRVVPAHSFKFAAALQHAQQGNAPTLIRIETKAGHGGGKPTSKRIADEADTYAFLVKVLGMK